MSRFVPVIPLMALLAACGSGSDPSAGRPVVSVSILPQKYFVEKLAGELVEVNVLIPPGASPATYEPTVSQLGRLRQSEHYMKMGYLGFELSWMDRIRAVNPSITVWDLSEGIQLIRGEEHGTANSAHTHGGIDPHIWMSARNARSIVNNMHASLCALLPSDTEYLTRNKRVMMASLDTLDTRIMKMLEGLEQRSFMIYHPALTYFARDYGLEQISMEPEGKIPSPSHLRKMADLGKDHRINTLLIQAEFDRKNAEILAGEIGAKIVQIDPLALDWYNQMLFIANTIKTSLE